MTCTIRSHNTILAQYEHQGSVNRFNHKISEEISNGTFHVSIISLNYDVSIKKGFLETRKSREKFESERHINGRSYKNNYGDRVRSICIYGICGTSMKLRRLA